MFRRIVHSIREVAELAEMAEFLQLGLFKFSKRVSALSISPRKDQSPEPQVADPYAFAVQQGMFR